MGGIQSPGNTCFFLCRCITISFSEYSNVLLCASFRLLFLGRLRVLIPFCRFLRLESTLFICSYICGQCHWLLPPASRESSTSIQRRSWDRTGWWKWRSLCRCVRGRLKFWEIRYRREIFFQEKNLRRRISDGLGRGKEGIFLSSLEGFRISSCDGFGILLTLYSYPKNYIGRGKGNF